MRILTPLARPGQRLRRSLTSRGAPLFGAGTQLTRRYLRVIHEEGIRYVEVEPEASIADWEVLPTVDTFITDLNGRFAGHERDGRMMAMKQSIQDVYLEFLFELEGSK
ncbi:MAG: hypothetical protein ACON3Z_18005 [Bradymonadia bacterium]